MGVSRKSNHCCDAVTTIMTDSQGITIWKRNFSTNTIDTDISNDKVFSIGHFRQYTTPVVDELKTYDVSGNNYEYYTLSRNSTIENVDYSSLDYFGNKEESKDLFNFAKVQNVENFSSPELDFRQLYENANHVITNTTGVIDLSNGYSSFVNEYHNESGTDSRVFTYDGNIFVLSDNLIQEYSESGDFKAIHIFSKNTDSVPYKNMDLYGDNLFTSKMYPVADLFLPTGNLINIQLKEPYQNYNSLYNYRFNLNINNVKWDNEHLGDLSIEGIYSGKFIITNIEIPSGYNYISSGHNNGLISISGFNQFESGNYNFTFDVDTIPVYSGYMLYSMSGEYSKLMEDKSYNLNYTFNKANELLNKKQSKFYYQGNKIFNGSDEVASGYISKLNVVNEHSFRDNVLYNSKYEYKSNLNSFTEMSKAIHRETLMISLKSFFLIKKTDEDGLETWHENIYEPIGPEVLSTINKYWINTQNKWLWKKLDYLETEYHYTVSSVDPGYFFNIYEGNINNRLNPTYVYMNTSGLYKEIPNITPTLTEDSNLFVAKFASNPILTSPTPFPILMHNKSNGVQNGNIKSITYEKYLFVPSGVEDYNDIINFVNERYTFEPYKKIRLPTYDWDEFTDILTYNLVRKGFHDDYFANAASYESARNINLLGSRKYSLLDFAYIVDNNPYFGPARSGIDVKQKITSYDLQSYYVGNTALLDIKTASGISFNNDNAISLNSDYHYFNNTCFHNIRYTPSISGQFMDHAIKNISRFINTSSSGIYRVLDESGKLICTTNNWSFSNQRYPFTQNVTLEYPQDLTHAAPFNILDNIRHNLYLDTELNSGICYDLFAKEVFHPNADVSNSLRNFLNNETAELVLNNISLLTNRLDKSSDISVISDSIQYKDYNILDSFPDYYIGYGYIDNYPNYYLDFFQTADMLQGTRTDKNIYTPNDLDYQQYANRLTTENTGRLFRATVKYSKMFDNYIKEDIIDDIQEHIHNSGSYKVIMDGYSYSNNNTEIRINRPRIKNERI